MTGGRLGLAHQHVLRLFRPSLHVTAVVVTLSGCASLPLSALHPAGDGAARIATLVWVLIGGFGVIWLAMVALFLAVMIRPGRFAGIRVGDWALWGGVVLPLVVTVPLFVWAALITHRLWPADVPEVTIDAEAYQWGWRFTYPQVPGAVSENVLYLSAGQEVALRATSRDVIHSVWIPRLAGKLDVIPGHISTLRLIADAPGVIEGQCAEFCGLGHTEMRFIVVIGTSQEYAATVAGLRAGTTPASIDALDDATLVAAQGAGLSAPRAPSPAERPSR